MDSLNPPRTEALAAVSRCANVLLTSFCFLRNLLRKQRHVNVSGKQKGLSQISWLSTFEPRHAKSRPNLGCRGIINERSDYSGVSPVGATLWQPQADTIRDVTCWCGFLHVHTNGNLKTRRTKRKYGSADSKACEGNNACQTYQKVFKIASVLSRKSLNSCFNIIFPIFGNPAMPAD